MSSKQQKFFIIAGIVTGMLFTTNGISAQSNTSSIFDYYWQDGSGKILRTGSGGCLHTPQWQTGMSDCPAAALRSL